MQTMRVGIFRVPHQGFICIISESALGVQGKMFSVFEGNISCPRLLARKRSSQVFFFRRKKEDVCPKRFLRLVKIHTKQFSKELRPVFLLHPYHRKSCMHHRGLVGWRFSVSFHGSSKVGLCDWCSRFWQQIVHCMSMAPRLSKAVGVFGPCWHLASCQVANLETLWRATSWFCKFLKSCADARGWGSEQFFVSACVLQFFKSFSRIFPEVHISREHFVSMCRDAWRIQLESVAFYSYVSIISFHHWLNRRSCCVPAWCFKNTQ